MVKNRVPKTALFTKPVYVKDKGVAISKAKVVDRDFNGDILTVSIKIDNKLYIVTPSMAEKMRRQALIIANKNLRNYGTKVYNKKGELETIKVNKKVRNIIRQKTEKGGSIYNYTKNTIFIDNILRKSGITINDTMLKYIKGNSELESVFNKVIKNLKKMNNEEFDKFYSAYKEEFKDFSNFYKQIQEQGEVGNLENGLMDNLNTLLENLESWFAS